MHHNSHTANYNNDATFLASSSPKLQNAIQTGIALVVFPIHWYSNIGPCAERSGSKLKFKIFAKMFV